MEPVPSLFPVAIEGDRVRLREFTSQDLDRIWEWEGRPEFFRYLAFTALGSFEEERAWLDGVMKKASARPRRRYHLGIELREGRLLIGAVRLKIESIRARSASLSYGLHPDEWGNGYATEGASLIVKFGFETLGLHRIWAAYHPANGASGRILEKIGMRQEGRLRDDRFVGGRWHDSVVCSILDGDWQVRG